MVERFLERKHVQAATSVFDRYGREIAIIGNGGSGGSPGGLLIGDNSAIPGASVVEPSRGLAGLSPTIVGKEDGPKLFETTGERVVYWGRPWPPKPRTIPPLE